MSIRRQGDASRRRRFIGPPAKLRWYALHRSRRWARRFFGDPPAARPRRAS
jgi:hypothetical protein